MVWAESMYCVIVVLLVSGGHLPLNPLRMGLAQIDMWAETFALGLE